MKWIEEIQQMFLTGTLGILMRFAYIKRKDPNTSKSHILFYFIISYSALVLLIVFLKDRSQIFNIVLDDGTKMIIAAVVSWFSDRLFTFLMDNESALFRGVIKKGTGIDINKKEDGNNL